MITRPMLACNDTYEFAHLRFPLLATPKIDGIRCIVSGGRALSRNFKPIPNVYIRTWIEHNCPEGFDGELVVPGTFHDTTSAVMSHSGTPPFAYRVFDFVEFGDLNAPYHERIANLKQWIQQRSNTENAGPINPVYFDAVEDEEELLAFEATALEEGYEGVILRTPNGRYKCGRSTFKEHLMLKLKRFVDSEAVIEDFEELQHNENEARTSPTGLTERSSHAALQRPGGTLGALFVRDLYSNRQFSIGSGFTQALRDEIWANQVAYRGKTITYKYQPHGVKDLPRHPVFKGFRQ